MISIEEILTRFGSSGNVVQTHPSPHKPICWPRSWDTGHSTRSPSSSAPAQGWQPA